MIPLPIAGPPQTPCTECGKCCTYVSVGINPPSRLRYASDILWYLYHAQVSVYRDGDGEWSVVFEARCRQLQDDRLCRIYPDRPLVCRKFDDSSCEVNAPDGGRSFERAQDFLEFLRAEHPGVFARLVRGYAPPELQPARRKRKTGRPPSGRGLPGGSGD